MASRSASRPQSTPMPIGPSILWPVKATKSASMAWTSVARWGTYWLASTSTSAPAACAASASWRTGLMVPSTLDMADTQSSLAPSRSRSRSVRSSVPSAVTGIQRSSTPFSAASMCHGTMLAWCSSSVSTTASPSPRLARPHVLATRLMASVAFLANTTSALLGALMNAFTLSRAPSRPAVASLASWYEPRCTFAL